MAKPTVNTKCVASNYAARNERVVEFFDADTQKGGLISIRADAKGLLRVEVYRMDQGVYVVCGRTQDTYKTQP
jgi:hypothetical protein